MEYEKATRWGRSDLKLPGTNAKPSSVAERARREKTLRHHEATIRDDQIDQTRKIIDSPKFRSLPFVARPGVMQQMKRLLVRKFESLREDRK